MIIIIKILLELWETLPLERGKRDMKSFWLQNMDVPRQTSRIQRKWGRKGNIPIADVSMYPAKLLGSCLYMAGFWSKHRLWSEYWFWSEYWPWCMLSCTRSCKKTCWEVWSLSEVLWCATPLLLGWKFWGKSFPFCWKLWGISLAFWVKLWGMFNHWLWGHCESSLIWREGVDSGTSFICWHGRSCSGTVGFTGSNP